MESSADHENRNSSDENGAQTPIISSENNVISTRNHDEQMQVAHSQGSVDQLQFATNPVSAESISEFPAVQSIVQRTLSTVLEGTSNTHVQLDLALVYGNKKVQVGGNFTNINNPKKHQYVKIPDKDKERMDIARFTYVPTTGYGEVSNALEQNDHVLICGSPGSGKTDTSLVIMGEYRKKKYNEKRYDVQFIDTVSEFDIKRLDLSHPTILVFDDIFGRFAPQQAEWDHCTKLFDFLDSHFRYIQYTGNTSHHTHNTKYAPFKVIMNSRTNIWNVVKSKLSKYELTLFSKVTDLTVDTKLNDCEKESILMEHMKRAKLDMSETEIQNIAMLEYNTLGFPYICKLFVDYYKSIKSAIQFFKEPIVYLKDIIENIFSPHELPSRAAVLLLIVLNDGSLNLIDLCDSTQRSNTGLEEKLQRVREIISGSPSPHDMNCAAQDEIQTLLVSEGSLVKFSHPTIHDAVAYVVGKRNSVFVLKNCSLRFILERTHVLDKTKAGTRYVEDFIIDLDEHLSGYLLKRLARELVNGNIEHTLSHQCLSSEENIETLFSEISMLGDINGVLHFRDGTFGLCFLFWSSFTCVGPLWKAIYNQTIFSNPELLEGCFGCCMSGNVLFFQALTSQIIFGKETLKSTIGDILNQPKGTKSLYRRLSAAESQATSVLSPKRETVR